MKQLTILFILLSVSVLGQTPKKLSQPERDFEVFWTTFKDNYAFFTLKGVNWDSTYLKYRPLITPKTSQKALISVLGKLVDPLKDGHITISKGDDILYKGKHESQFRQEFKGVEQQFRQTIDTTLQRFGFQKPAGIGPVFKGEHLYYLSTSAEIAYLSITRCFGTPESLFDDRKEAEDLQLMLRLADSLLTRIRDTKALIIDLRTNGGGHGGLELASRFIKTKTLTHYKAIRQKGSYDTFTTPEPQYSLPNTGTQYLKPLILLTSDRTASSAEDFTISLYRQDNVTTIGTHTSGMLSDMFSGELSDNVAFTLSNQVYYSADKQILEDKGVPAAITIVNTKRDIEDRKDPVLVKAIEVVSKKI